MKMLIPRLGHQVYGLVSGCAPTTFSTKLQLCMLDAIENWDTTHPALFDIKGWSHFRRHPVPKSMRDERMSVIKRWGRLSLDRRKNLAYHGLIAFYCRCDCGAELYLSSKEIYQRETLSLGCAGPDCPATGARALPWCRAELALRLQISQACAVVPDYRDSLSEEDTIDSELAMLLSLGHGPLRSPGAWWVSNPEAFSTLRFKFGHSPSRELFPRDEVLIDVEGELLTIAQVSQSFNVPEEKVMALKPTMWDRDLVEHLIMTEVSSDAN